MEERRETNEKTEKVKNNNITKLFWKCTRAKSLLFTSPYLRQNKTLKEETIFILFLPRPPSSFGHMKTPVYVFWCPMGKDKNCNVAR